MCQAVRCEKCKKMGWRGCGAHVEMVLGGVAKKDRCECEGGAQSKPLIASIRDMLGLKND